MLSQGGIKMDAKFGTENLERYIRQEKSGYGPDLAIDFVQAARDESYPRVCEVPSTAEAGDLFRYLILQERMKIDSAEAIYDEAFAIANHA